MKTKSSCSELLYGYGISGPTYRVYADSQILPNFYLFINDDKTLEAWEGSVVELALPT